MLNVTCSYCAYCLDEAMLLRERGRIAARREAEEDTAHIEGLKQRARSGRMF